MYIKDPGFTDHFNPAIKGKVAYEVGSFGVREIQAMNIYPLPHWDFFYRVGEGLIGPEMRDAWKRHDPNRVKIGEKALVCHVSGKYQSWWAQRAEMPFGPVTIYFETRNKWAFRNSDTYIDDAYLSFDGNTLRASVYMHAWSNHRIPGFNHVGDPSCSAGVGCNPVAIMHGDAQEWIRNNIPNATKEMKDAVDNFTFRVGIDVKGGWNPLSDDVVWGDGWHIYNGYCQKIVCELDVHEQEPEPPGPEPGPTGKSKVGPHVIRAASGLQEHLNAGPAVVKFVGDYNMPVPEGCLVIGRSYADTDYQLVDAYKAGRDPESEARRFFDIQREEYENNNHIVYWEGPNEPVLWGDDVDDNEAMLWYARFEIARMELMDEILGKKCVIGNFATGTPPLNLWQDFIPAIREGLKYKAVLGVHEYSHPWKWWMTGKYQLDPNEDQGDEGWTTLRYRKAYRNYFLPLGLQIPLVITESGIDALVNPKPPGTPAVQWKELRSWWRENHDGEIPWPGDPDLYYAHQIIWYDKELQKDSYVVGQTVFCWGNYGQEWEKFDVAGTDAATELTRYIEENPSESFVWEKYGKYEEEEEVNKYKRKYRIADPTFMSKEELDEAYAEARRNMNTVGPSWQDAVPYAKDRPDEWEENIVIISTMPLVDRPRYREWVKSRDPNTKLVFEDSEDDGEIEYIDLVGELPTNPDSTWYPYKRRSMDEPIWAIVHHTAGPKVVGSGVIDHIKSIANSHCFGDRKYPGIAYTFMIDDDGKLYRVNEPETISFAHGRKYSGTDENRLGIPVCLIGNFMDEEPSDKAMATLERTIEYLDKMTTHDLEVGGHKDLAPTDCPGATWPWKEEWGLNPKTPLAIGLHDTPGGEWMIREGLKGICLTHWTFEMDPAPRDFSYLENAGIDVIARINWGYADGSGTMPRPDRIDTWIDCAIDTIRRSRGVKLWHPWNEVNNMAEWPIDDLQGLYELTPEYVVESYNKLWDRTRGIAKIGPPPLDPYFGPGSNNSAWWNYMMKEIKGADALFLHAKTQGSHPRQVWSHEKFEHWPLQWQYLHLRAIEPYLAMIPLRLSSCPVYVTEVNTQRKSSGEIGWDSGNAEWIHEATDYFRSSGVDGIVFYRWHADEWRLRDKPVILQAIAEEIRK